MQKPVPDMMVQMLFMDDGTFLSSRIRGDRTKDNPKLSVQQIFSLPKFPLFQKTIEKELLVSQTRLEKDWMGF